MQQCPTCNKEIKYIALSYDRSAICEVEKKEIITENGKIFQGYLRHICNNDECGVIKKENG